jgi:hypothetical protein
VVYGAALEICLRVSQKVVLASKQYSYVNHQNPALNVKYHAVTTTLILSISKLLAKTVRQAGAKSFTATPNPTQMPP